VTDPKAAEKRRALERRSESAKTLRDRVARTRQQLDQTMDRMREQMRRQCAF
jgi:hypothetical protein